MEIVLISWIGSLIISIVMANVIGSHYLERNDRLWKQVFEDMKKFILDKLDHS